MIHCVVHHLQTLHVLPLVWLCSLEAYASLQVLARVEYLCLLSGLVEGRAVLPA